MGIAQSQIIFESMRPKFALCPIPARILVKGLLYFHEIRDGVALGGKMRAMLISSLTFLALYGAVMGSTHSLWQALSSAAKLPVLF